MNPRLLSWLMAALALTAFTPAVDAHSPAGFGPSPFHEDNIISELLEPGCIIFATLAFALLGLAMWSSSLKASGEKSTSTVLNGSPRSSADAKSDGALGWLAALVITSFLLLILQLGAGFSTGALTLIADSAHTAADAVSYAFNWLVERAKRSAATAQSDRVSRAAIRFDAWSALFSVAILLCTSACATADALDRLFGMDAPTRNVGNEQKADLGFIGHALLGFAIVSTAVNVLLLFLHRCRLGASRTTDASPPPQLELVSESLSLVPPPPPPIPRENGREWSAKRANRLALLHQAFHPSCDLANCPVGAATTSVTSLSLPPPPPPPPSIPRQNRRERPAKRSNKVAWLHQAFHPNCNCPTGTHAESVSSPSSPQESLDATSPQEETNLNLYGAVLHLFTDVLRSLVILVVGLLVELGVIHDAVYADAICAIVVSICIILGSLALLHAAAKTLCGMLSDVARQASTNNACRTVPV